MAGRPQMPSNNSAIIAMIADEDTVTGFLLAGVGNVDLRRKTNYLIVDSKTTVKAIEDAFKEFTGKEDVAIVLISQYLVYDHIVDMSLKHVHFKEEAFSYLEKYVSDHNSLIQVANMIRFHVDSYNKPVPAILEIPSKDHPYDPTHDSVLSRVKYLFSSDSSTSDRR